MKSAFGYQRIRIVLLALVLVQVACSFGIQPSNGGSQETQSNDTQAAKPAPATLSERGTPDEAKAMLPKALDHYNAVGREKALADFNGGVAPYFDRDLYVVCMDADQVETANGGFPQ